MHLIAGLKASAAMGHMTARSCSLVATRSSKIEHFLSDFEAKGLFQLEEEICHALQNALGVVGP